MKQYYVARKEGLFDTTEAALAHTGLPQDEIQKRIANAQRNRSPIVWCPCNGDYGVLVNKEWDGFGFVARFSFS